MATDVKERQIPFTLIGVGIAVYILGAFIHAGASGVAPTLLIVLIGAAIQTAILIGAAFLVAAVLSVSFGEVRTAILKFAGIALVSGALGVLLPFGAGLVSLFVFLGLVIWLFELEFVYAIALTVAYWIISFAVLFALRSVAA